MSKEFLQKYIDLYKLTEKQVVDLDDKFGVQIWNSRTPNFYNNYNLIIRRLLVELFQSEEKVDLLENYIFEQIEMTFDELCKALEIDETDKK